MRGTTTSWVVIAIGIIVSLIGYYFLDGLFGAGVLGHGLAWVLLGALDLMRPSVRH
ncbi:MAG TPA: hypothetical protein GXX38_00025 [Clostridia bacterium]|mgnify:CR=1 FL=1|jgi:hypothetical protein|nr:hypothetical protein [Clostridia bacterium]